jgi:hypothetical protein
MRQLLRVLERSAAALGCTVALSHEATTPWASATFVGAQYRVAVGGGALDAWLAALPEAELPLSGCFVADCTTEPAPGGAMLTLLVLEE